MTDVSAMATSLVTHLSTNDFKSIVLDTNYVRVSNNNRNCEEKTVGSLEHLLGNLKHPCGL